MERRKINEVQIDITSLIGGKDCVHIPVRVGPLQSCRYPMQCCIYLFAPLSSPGAMSIILKE